jgi:YggT family protein
MIAAFNNAFLLIVRSLFDIALSLFLVRVLLQAVRADFYNPISQLVWRVTQTVAAPLQRLLPRRGRIDVACALILYALSFLYIETISSMLGLSVGAASAAWFALLEIVMLLFKLYTLFLLVQAILSWVGPGVSNPAANILWSLNEPLLRPVRRIIPPLSGLDFSPLIVMVILQVLVLFIPLPGLF